MKASRTKYAECIRSLAVIYQETEDAHPDLFSICDKKIIILIEKVLEYKAFYYLKLKDKISRINTLKEIARIIQQKIENGDTYLQEYWGKIKNLIFLDTLD